MSAFAWWTRTRKLICANYRCALPNWEGFHLGASLTVKICRKITECFLVTVCPSFDLLLAVFSSVLHPCHAVQISCLDHGSCCLFLRYILSCFDTSMTLAHRRECQPPETIVQTWFTGVSTTMSGFFSHNIYVRWSIQSSSLSHSSISKFHSMQAMMSRISAKAKLAIKVSKGH